MASTQSHKRKLSWEPSEDDPTAKKPRLDESARKDLDLLPNPQARAVASTHHDLKEPAEPQDSFISDWLQSISPESSADMVKAGGLPLIASLVSTTRTASSQDSNFVETLEHYRIYVNDRRHKVPQAIKARALAIISKERPSSDGTYESDEYYEDVVLAMTLATETEVQNEWELGLSLSTQLNKTRENLRSAKDQIWCNAPTLARAESNLPLIKDLTKPKPDCTIGFSNMPFSESQTQAIQELVEGIGKTNYGRPDNSGIIFPFLTMEYKSLGRLGVPHQAAGQNANSGAVMLYSFEKLREKSQIDNDSFDNQTIRFSITLDQLTASVYVHWTAKPQSGKRCWLSQRVVGVYLNRAGVKTIREAIWNIMDYAEDEILPEVQKHLDSIIMRGCKRKAESEAEVPPVKSKVQASATNGD